MKLRTGKLLAFLAAVVFVLASCSKYEEGGFSLFKTGTLAGDWELDGVDWIDEDYEWFEMSDVDVATLSITKDGDWNLTIEWDIEGAEDTKEDGTWEWEDDKTEIEITYEDGGKEVMDVIKLSKKSLILEDGAGSLWEWVPAE